MTTSPAAAAPTRRLEQVAPPQSSRESARLARADGSESVERCQIPMIVQCRSRRSAARARASVLCQCCRISDLLSMTPYLALARSRRHQRRRPSSIDCALESANTHSLKQNGDVDDLFTSRCTNQAARSGQSAARAPRVRACAVRLMCLPRQDRSGPQTELKRRQGPTRQYPQNAAITIYAACSLQVHLP